MAEDRYISGLPNGVAIGGLVAFIFGFFPILNFIGAYLGGMIAAYIEETGIVKSIGSGIIVGLIGLGAFVVYALLALVVTGGGSVFSSDLMIGAGALGGFFGGIYAIVSLFFNPIAGAAGGFSLGIYFHLIHKATD